MNEQHSVDFIKMEGTANDYVFIDRVGSDRAAAQLASGWPASAEPGTTMGSALIARMADRHTGVGGDGVVFIDPPYGDAGDALARMRMFNADGSPSAMCGNALRCIALFARMHLTEAAEFQLQSDVGLHRVRVLGFDSAAREGVFEINLGAPVFTPEEVPFDLAQLAPDAEQLKDGPLLNVQLNDPRAAAGKHAIPPATVLSMGNPHCVLFVDDADYDGFEELGPLLERHPAFPARTNVEFVSITADGLYQRTYERGTGETLSCGSGACAVHVAAVLTGRSGPVGRIQVRGGELELEWQGSADSDAGVIMRGPARVAFEGRANLC